MGYSVLLIDNEPLIIEGMRILVKTYLANVGDIHVAYSGEDGVTAALEHMPDVVITDIRMSDMDGLGMIKVLKEHGCRSRFIIMSGYEEFDYAKQAIALGVDEFLTKPIEEEELINAWNKTTGKIKEDGDSNFIHDLQGNAMLAMSEYRDELEKGNGIQHQNDIISSGEVGELELAIALSDITGCKKVIERIFQSIEEKGISHKESKLVAIKIVMHGIRKVSHVELEGNQYILRLNTLDRLRNNNQRKIWVIETFDKLIKSKSEISKNTVDVITAVKEYIMTNYSMDISLNDISGRFFINPTYFSGLFKKKTGMTYMKYLTMVRVHKAKKLLDETEMKIYEICEAVGYSDVNHLNRMFEREYGMKPFEYRKKMQNTYDEARK